MLSPQERENHLVISFHTCDSDELEEISCDSGATRIYESGATGLLKESPVSGKVPAQRIVDLHKHV